jgi:hypothetical protein
MDCFCQMWMQARLTVTESSLKGILEQLKRQLCEVTQPHWTKVAV